MAQTPLATVRITGLDIAIARLRALPADIRMRVLKNAVIEGATVYSDAASRYAPKSIKAKNKLATDIKPRRILADWYHEIAWSVVIRGKGHKGFIAHMIEFGHVFITKKNGYPYVTGYYAPHPYMMPAFRSETPNVIDKFKSRLIGYMRNKRYI